MSGGSVTQPISAASASTADSTEAISSERRGRNTTAATYNRQAWILVAASATHHWIAWRSDSFAPKVERCGAYSQIMSSACLVLVAAPQP